MLRNGGLHILRVGVEHSNRLIRIERALYRYGEVLFKGYYPCRDDKNRPTVKEAFYIIYVTNLTDLKKMLSHQDYILQSSLNPIK